GKILKRIKVKPLFAKIRLARQKFDSEVDPARPNAGKSFSLAKFIRGVGDALAAADIVDANGNAEEFIKGLMENVIDERMLLAMMVVSHREGPGAVKAIIKGKFPLRMTAAELFMAIAIIEESAKAGVLDNNNYSLPLIGETDASEEDRAVKWKIRDKYKNIFIEPKYKQASEPNPTPYVAINKMNGDAFHLAKIAALLSEGKAVIGVESPVNLQFRRTNKLTRQTENFGQPLKRRVDIVTGAPDNASFWEVKSLAYNRMTAAGGVNKGVAGVSTLDLVNLKDQVISNDDRMVLGEDANDNFLRIKASQFYSKEIFVDRVFAGANLADIPAKMKWIFQDFYKSDMPRYATSGRTYVLDAKEKDFEQCGFNNSVTERCRGVYSGKNPLADLREKLVNGVRHDKKPEVLDVIRRTFGLSSQDEAEEYVNEFKGLASLIIKAESSKQLTLDSVGGLALSCGVI